MSQSNSNKVIPFAATLAQEKNETDEQQPLPTYKDQVTGRNDRRQASEELVPTVSGILVEGSYLAGGQEGSRTVMAHIIQTDVDVETGPIIANSATGNITTNRNGHLARSAEEASTDQSNDSTKPQAHSAPAPFSSKKHLIWASVVFVLAVIAVSLAIALLRGGGSSESNSVPLPSPLTTSPLPATPLPPTPISVAPPVPTVSEQIWGTCGDGSEGNGICSLSDGCCSKWFWCQVDLSLCEPSFCGAGVVGNGWCSGADAGKCCSIDGYCHDCSCCAPNGNCGPTYCPAAPPTAPLPATSMPSIAPAAALPNPISTAQPSITPATPPPTPIPTAPPVPTVTDQIWGTCGGGQPGNGICNSVMLCCSTASWCQWDLGLCDQGSCGAGNVGDGLCTGADAGKCCSLDGYCHDCSCCDPNGNCDPSYCPTG